MVTSLFFAYWTGLPKAMVVWIWVVTLTFRILLNPFVACSVGRIDIIQLVVLLQWLSKHLKNIKQISSGTKCKNKTKQCNTSFESQNMGWHSSLIEFITEYGSSAFTCIKRGMQSGLQLQNVMKMSTCARISFHFLNKSDWREVKRLGATIFFPKHNEKQCKKFFIM